MIKDITPESKRHKQDLKKLKSIYKELEDPEYKGPKEFNEYWG